MGLCRQRPACSALRRCLCKKVCCERACARCRFVLCMWQVQPHHLVVRHDSLATVHPLDDAFTMSFKAVLRHACRRSHHHCHRAAGHRGKAALAEHR